MVEGQGEGMMVVTQDDIKKWKIGAEINNSNVRIIDSLIELIIEDKRKFYKTLLDSLQSSFLIGHLIVLREIQLSTKTNGEEKPEGEYEIAIKSAMTKFDDYKKFEFDEYLDLIAQECLEDIKIGDGK